ncbi:MAG: hypothetical protein V7637_5419 [Mycobacteriales bacterium]
MRLRLALAVAVVVLLAGAAVAVWWMRRPDGPPVSAHAGEGKDCLPLGTWSRERPGDLAAGVVIVRDGQRAYVPLSGSHRWDHDGWIVDELCEH